MPKYRITAPDGQTFEVNAPDGATEQDAMAYVQKNLYKPKAKEVAPDPSEGGINFRPFGLDTGLEMPQGVSRFLAGAGKAFADTGRGAGQMLGLVDRADIDESKKRDAPLMNTGVGTAGNITGQIAQFVPAAAAGGIPAAIAVGAGQGALTPVGTDESRLKNVAIGGALGGAGPVIARGASAAYQGGKALLEPFTQGGRERIAGRVLERFAEDPATVRAAASMTGPTRTGSMPTLAEQSGDVGIARLQDSLRALDPQINTAVERQLAGNNAARVERLRELAGQGGARDAAVTARQTAAAPQYEAAFANRMDDTLAPRAAELLEAPAIARAATQARTNAQNAGQQLGPEGSIRGLHEAKLALDSAISNAEARAGNAAADANIAGLRAARERLTGFIEMASPEYQGARETYRTMSRPVNQADIGEQLLRSTSNTTDLPLVAGAAGVPRIHADAFMRQLRNGDQTVRSATGRNLGGLEDVLDPGQMSLVRSIGNEVDRAAAVGRVGNGPGSGTAQRLASTNLLRQVAGPTGLPQSFTESVLMSNLMRPVQFVYGTAEPAIQQTLARGLLDPGYAARVLDAASPKARKALQGLLDNELARGLAAPVAPAVGLLPQR